MMAEIIGLVGVGVTLIFTQYVTSRSTQKLITEVVTRLVGEMDRNTQCMLQKILRLQEETYELQKSMILCLRKIDLGMRANARMHGWVRLDNVSPEEAAKLPEPKEYDPQLRVCYYKPTS
jgi:hypothetical protein